MKAYYVMLDYKKIDVILGGYDTNVIMNGYMTFSDIEKNNDKDVCTAAGQLFNEKVKYRIEEKK